MSLDTPRALLEKNPVSAETREWNERVDSVLPVIRENRERTERELRSPDEVYEALRSAGITRMWVSREFGGEQVSIATGSSVVQRLAAADASVAWQMGVQGAIGRLSDYLPEPTARKLFRDGHGLVVGGVNPAGRAVEVEGGFRATGTWAFASGSAHAEWLVCNAVLFEDGAPVITPQGPRTRFVFVPKSEVTVLDTWHTVGLRGTGSHDYTLSDVFVPAEFTVAGELTLEPPASRPSRAYPIGYYDFGPFTSASTALGIARGALDALREVVVAKKSTGSSAVLAASHTVQQDLGRAEALLRASRLTLADAAWHAEHFGASGGAALSALVRVAAAQVAENASLIVDTAYRLAGTGSLYETSPLARYFRDVHSAVKHITLSHTHFEMAGQYLLGGELRMRR